MSKLTHADVVSVLGPVGEDLVAVLLRMDASAEELALAREWLDNEDALANAHVPPPSGRVAQIADLIADDLDEEDVVETDLR